MSSTHTSTFHHFFHFWKTAKGFVWDTFKRVKKWEKSNRTPLSFIFHIPTTAFCSFSAPLITCLLNIKSPVCNWNLMVTKLTQVARIRTFVYPNPFYYKFVIRYTCLKVWPRKQNQYKNFTNFTFFFRSGTSIWLMFLILALGLFESKGLYVRVSACDDTKMMTRTHFFSEKRNHSVTLF